MQNTLHRLAILAAISCSTPLVHAAPVTWTFQDAAFANGRTVTGYFVFDAEQQANNGYSLINIQVSDTGTPLTLLDINLDGLFGGSGSTNLQLIEGFSPNDNLGKRFFNFHFWGGSLATSVGPLQLVNTQFPTNLSVQGVCLNPACTSVGITPGGIVRGYVQAVPEVSTWTYVITGLLAVGALVRRRTRPTILSTS